MNIVVSLLIIFLAIPLGFGEEHDDHGHEGEEEAHGGDEHKHGEESEKFGGHKAITKVKENGRGFQLSEKAEKIMGIKTVPLEKIKGSDVFKIPSSSLVEHQDKQGLFTKHEGWYLFIPVTLLKSESGFVQVKTDHKLLGSELVVVSGVPLLRVAHLEATGQGGVGHIH